MSPNKYRGEVELKIGARTHTLRPTFDAIAKIETELGQGIYGVMSMLANPRTISIQALVCVISNCRTEKDNLHRAVIGKSIMEDKPTKIALAVGNFLAEALMPDEPEGDGSPVEGDPGNAK